MRLYYWTFTGGSGVPQYRADGGGLKQYFKWEVEPHEIADASPIYADVAQKLLPEVTQGKGDGLVSIENSKLPWPSTHKTNDLNHAEVLFDRSVQREVAQILGVSRFDDVAVKVALPTTRISKGIELPRRLAATTTTAPVTPVAARQTEAAAPSQPFSMTPNPQMKGRLGRIVVAYPKATPCKGSHVAIRKPGEDSNLKTFYGGGEEELMPGKYVVLINNKPVGEVVVQSKNDSKIRTGILHVNAGKSTHIQLLDADGTTKLLSDYGEQEWGLPVGKYHLQIAGQTEPIEVTEDQVTEF